MIAPTKNHVIQACRKDTIDRVRQSLQAVVAGYSQDDALSSNQALLELGRVAEKLESHYPKQFQMLLEPVVEQVVEHAGEDIVRSLSQLIKTFNAKKWSSYGDMLLEAIRSQGVVKDAAVNALASQYRATRLAREIRPFDHSKSCATVKQYLALLDKDPPQGAFTMDDVRHVLEKGLAWHYPSSDSDAEHDLVESVTKSLRLIAGGGPFLGSQSELIKSVERFSKTYIDVCRNKEPVHAALATFLALSFYDISTPGDHDALFEQISRLSVRFQSQVNAMLRAHAMNSLVTPEVVEGIFHQYYEEEFRGYVDDPLCPAFKFPLTANEEARLTNQLILSFNQLEPLFEDIALKLKYGGLSPELREATILGISQAAQELLPSTAFLRRPSYPGVICHYRGAHGFATVIPETIYRAGDRPKKRFQAMQYFHLGHRIEDIVKRELALARKY